MARCRLCSEKAVGGNYCKLHHRAYRALKGKFPAWEGALGVSWKRYLEEIITCSFTGEKAKEVARALREGM